MSLSSLPSSQGLAAELLKTSFTSQRTRGFLSGSSCQNICQHGCGSSGQVIIFIQQERLPDVLPGAADQRRVEPLQPKGAHGGDWQKVAQTQPQPEGEVQEAGGGAAGGVQGGAGSLGEGESLLPTYWHNRGLKVHLLLISLTCPRLVSVIVPAGPSHLQGVFLHGESLPAFSH